MAKWKQETPFELRRLASEFRGFASGATMPGYAGKMRHAADELKQRADALEYIGSHRLQADLRTKLAVPPAA